MRIEHPGYFGQLLHSKGFRVWTKYMFKLIEGKPFIEESIHAGLFQVFQDIYDKKSLRDIINVPPRSGKTTLAKYFIAYCLALNQKCNFIYTSFSQSLLGQISDELATILRHPVYSSMYDSSFNEDEEEEDPLNEFWKEYLKSTTGKSKYSSRKIITSAGGVIVFASIGSQITGHGCGIRGAINYSGGMFVDDPQKPAEISSEVMRLKVQAYFEETLLSRPNDSNVHITIIQQRLHLEDLSGFLNEHYEYRTLKRPLMVDGVCQIPSQYSEERLKEIQRNEAMFSAQYQQDPIKHGGNLFKKYWFEYVNYIPKIENFEIIFAVVDSAYNDKQKNDFFVLSIFGILKDRLYLIDVIREKISSIYLPIKIQDNLLKYHEHEVNGERTNKLHYCWVENKSSGISIIQGFTSLKVKSFVKMPKMEETKEFMKRSVNKYERAQEVIPYINDVDKNILIYTGIKCYSEIIKELLEFPDGEHDDFVDTLIDGIRISERYYIKKKQDVDLAIKMFNNYGMS